jgi:hypothetical protein
VTTGQDSDDYSDRAGIPERSGRLIAGAAGGQDIIHQQDFFAAQTS